MRLNPLGSHAAHPAHVTPASAPAPSRRPRPRPRLHRRGPERLCSRTAVARGRASSLSAGPRSASTAQLLGAGTARRAPGACAPVRVPAAAAPGRETKGRRRRLVRRRRRAGPRGGHDGPPDGAAKALLPVLAARPAARRLLPVDGRVGVPGQTVVVGGGGPDAPAAARPAPALDPAAEPAREMLVFSAQQATPPFRLRARPRPPPRRLPLPAGPPPDARPDGRESAAAPEGRARARAPPARLPRPPPRPARPTPGRRPRGPPRVTARELARSDPPAGASCSTCGRARRFPSCARCAAPSARRGRRAPPAAEQRPAGRGRARAGRRSGWTRRPRGGGRRRVCTSCAGTGTTRRRRRGRCGRPRERGGGGAVGRRRGGRAEGRGGGGRSPVSGAIRTDQRRP